MSNNTIQFIRSDAWIFLSVAGAAADKLAPLDEIMGLADAINHAIPTEREFEGGFTRLLQAGLIRQDERALGLTSKGMALADRCRQKSKYWLEQWDFLAEIIETESFLNICDLVYRLEPGEGEKTYKIYSGRFIKTPSKITDEEKG